MYLKGYRKIGLLRLPFDIKYLVIIDLTVTPVIPVRLGYRPR